MRNILFIAAVLTAALTSLVFAQSTTNPDISFIGDFRAAIHNQTNKEDKGKANLDLHELEFTGSGNLNPYSRADINIAFGEEGIDLEEAYLTVLRGLPFRLQSKVGKYLLDFGKLNSQHPHQWLWLERPLMYQSLFGEEGWKDIGLQLNTLRPLGKQALGLSLNWVNGGGLIPEDDTEHPYPLSHIESAASGRISLFSPTSEFSNLELGLSGMRAQFNPVEISYETIPVPSAGSDFALVDFTPEKRFTTAIAIDAKWKWKPDSYRGIQFIGEYMQQRREWQGVIATEHSSPGIGDTTVTVSNRSVLTHGVFLAGEFRFLRRFDTGAFYDYTQSINNADKFQCGYGVYGAFSIAEETTRFGIVLRRNEATGNDPYNTATFQVLWALGPHKPHTF